MKVAVGLEGPSHGPPSPRPAKPPSTAAPVGAPPAPPVGVRSNVVESTDRSSSSLQAAMAETSATTEPVRMVVRRLERCMRDRQATTTPRAAGAFRLMWLLVTPCVPHALGLDLVPVHGTMTTAFDSVNPTTMNRIESHELRDATELDAIIERCPALHRWRQKSFAHPSCRPAPSGRAQEQPLAELMAAEMG